MPPETVRNQMLYELALAAERCDVASPRKPWLEPLPEQFSCAELDQLAQEASEAYSIGLIDDPGQQEQRLMSYRPSDNGNLCIVGGAGLGKTTVLQTIQYRLEQQSVPSLWISGAAEHRTEPFVGEYSGPMVLILDDAEVFRERYEFVLGSTVYQDFLAWVTRGREQRRYTVLSTNRAQAIPVQLLPYFRTTVFLGERHPEQPRPPTRSYLASLALHQESRIPGRGWVQDGGFREVQFAHPNNPASG